MGSGKRMAETMEKKQNRNRFSFVFGEIVYRIGWKYDKLGVSEIIKTRNSSPLPLLRPTVQTICTAVEEGSQEWVAVGLATNGGRDQFSKKVGRKISFARMLKSLFPDNKDARRIAWQWFLLMFPVRGKNR